MTSSPWAERLAEKYFGDAIHPYVTFEETVRQHLAPGQALLDAGCGHGAPVLKKFMGAAGTLTGVDLVNFDREIPGITLINRDLVDTGLPSASADIVISRSYFFFFAGEHVTDPTNMYAEMSHGCSNRGILSFLPATCGITLPLLQSSCPTVTTLGSLLARKAGKMLFLSRTRQTPVAPSPAMRLALDSRSSRSNIWDSITYFLFNGPLFLISTAYEKMIDRFPHCFLELDPRRSNESARNFAIAPRARDRACRDDEHAADLRP